MKPAQIILCVITTAVLMARPVLAVCGNSNLEMNPEECDDGNTANGDGCSSDCLIEPGWDCTGFFGSTCNIIQVNKLVCATGDTQQNVMTCTDAATLAYKWSQTYQSAGFGKLRAACISPKGNWFTMVGFTDSNASPVYNNRYKYGNGITGAITGDLPVISTILNACDYSNNGIFSAIGGIAQYDYDNVYNEGLVRILNRFGGTVGTWIGPADTDVNILAFSPDGLMIAIGVSNKVRIITLVCTTAFTCTATMSPETISPESAGVTSHLSWSNAVDGHLAVATSYTGAVLSRAIFDVNTMQWVKYYGVTVYGECNQLAFNFEGTRLLFSTRTISAGPTVAMFDPTQPGSTMPLLWRYDPPSGSTIKGSVWYMDGTLVLVAENSVLKRLRTSDGVQIGSNVAYTEPPGVGGTYHLIATQASVTCGDGLRYDGAEACDDGNRANGDGCSSTCAVESGWVCNTASPTVCAVCGNSVVTTGVETCDIGSNTSPGCVSCQLTTGWTCSSTSCAPPSVCGNGARETPPEACDDGNTAANDGCSATCQVESGWQCSTASPNVCSPICGDSVVKGGETCDIGSSNTSPGCVNCVRATGWLCTSTTCTHPQVCGDGVVDTPETCDDGNTANGDGCSSTCMREMMYRCIGQPSVCTYVTAASRVYVHDMTMKSFQCLDSVTLERMWIFKPDYTIDQSIHGQGLSHDGLMIALTVSTNDGTLATSSYYTIDTNTGLSVASSGLSAYVTYGVTFTSDDTRVIVVGVNNGGSGSWYYNKAFSIAPATGAVQWTSFIQQPWNIGSGSGFTVHSISPSGVQFITGVNTLNVFRVDTGAHVVTVPTSCYTGVWVHSETSQSPWHVLCFTNGYTTMLKIAIGPTPTVISTTSPILVAASPTHQLCPIVLDNTRTRVLVTTAFTASHPESFVWDTTMNGMPWQANIVSQGCAAWTDNYKFVDIYTTTYVERHFASNGSIESTRSLPLHAQSLTPVNQRTILMMPSPLSCGDSLVRGSETCDIGSNTSPGCVGCVLVSGWACTTSGCSRQQICGDGFIVGSEECDDGNTTGADGCSATCSREVMHRCSGEPSVCILIPPYHRVYVSLSNTIQCLDRTTLVSQWLVSPSTFTLSLYTMEVSPDGNWLVFAGNSLTGPTSAPIVIINTATGLSAASTSLPFFIIGSASFSADSSQLIVSGIAQGTVGGYYRRLVKLNRATLSTVWNTFVQEAWNYENSMFGGAVNPGATRVYSRGVYDASNGAHLGIGASIHCDKTLWLRDYNPNDSPQPLFHIVCVPYDTTTIIRITATSDTTYGYGQSTLYPASMHIAGFFANSARNAVLISTRSSSYNKEVTVWDVATASVRWAVGYPVDVVAVWNIDESRVDVYTSTTVTVHFASNGTIAVAARTLPNTMAVGTTAPIAAPRSPETCTDGVRSGVEQCDDGNAASGDGCSVSCHVENGWMCNTDVPNRCANCGNAVLESSHETCDIGANTSPGCVLCALTDGWTCTHQGCSSVCGDGLTVGSETCDIGSGNTSPGCVNCMRTTGWTCTGTSCSPICGDGLIVGSEMCDIGTSTSPGCVSCARTAGWTCTGVSCSPICGDGLIVGSETCDLGGNTSPGCTGCVLQTDWACTPNDGCSPCATGGGWRDATTGACLCNHASTGAICEDSKAATDPATTCYVCSLFRSGATPGFGSTAFTTIQAALSACPSSSIEFVCSPTPLGTSVTVSSPGTVFRIVPSGLKRAVITDRLTVTGASFVSDGVSFVAPHGTGAAVTINAHVSVTFNNTARPVARPPVTATLATPDDELCPGAGPSLSVATAGLFFDMLMGTVYSGAALDTSHGFLAWVANSTTTVSRVTCAMEYFATRGFAPTFLGRGGVSALDITMFSPFTMTNQLIVNFADPSTTAVSAVLNGGFLTMTTNTFAGIAGRAVRATGVNSMLVAGNIFAAAGGALGAVYIEGTGGAAVPSYVFTSNRHVQYSTTLASNTAAFHLHAMAGGFTIVDNAAPRITPDVAFDYGLLLSGFPDDISGLCPPAETELKEDERCVAIENRWVHGRIADIARSVSPIESDFCNNLCSEIVPVQAHEPSHTPAPLRAKSTPHPMFDESAIIAISTVGGFALLITVVTVFYCARKHATNKYQLI